MVLSETTKPSFCNSPWILGAPQSGFSSAKRRIRPRISSVTLGRPPCDRERQRQYSRKPARCQPTTVAGCTISSASAQRDQQRRSVVQNNLSSRVSCGRGRLRLKTASCCRNARISRAVSLRLRKKTWNAARKARIDSNTDHPFYHGATALGSSDRGIRKLLISENDSVSATDRYVTATLPGGVTGYGIFRESVPGTPDQEAVVPLASSRSTTSTLTWDDTNYTTAVAVANPS